MGVGAGQLIRLGFPPALQNKKSPNAGAQLSGAPNRYPRPLRTVPSRAGERREADKLPRWPDVDEQSVARYNCQINP